jgi:hypothetical protein
MGVHRLSVVLVVSLAGCCLDVRSTGTSASATTGGEGGTSGSGSSSGGTSGGTDLCADVKCQGPTCFGPVGEICDPADGVCKCYLGGPACFGSCYLDGGCAEPHPCTPCFGQCDPNEVCGPSDAQCHCGTLDGPICQGNSCRLFFADSGLQFFPDSGDPGNAAIVGQCGTSEPCYEVTCPPFEVCDPNNVDPGTGLGRCECGDPGSVCAANQTCVVLQDGDPGECLLKCNPFGIPCPPLAPSEGAQGCYFFDIDLGAACAPPTADAGMGQICQAATDCAPPLTCGVEALSAGKTERGCVPYCDVFPPGGPTSTPAPDGGTHACGPGTVCVPLSYGIAAGTCEPQ